MVPGPGIVDRAFYKADSIQGRETVSAKVFFAFGLVPAYHQDGFMAQDSRYNLCIAGLDLFYLIPERVFVRPGQLHKALGFPFGR